MRDENVDRYKIEQMRRFYEIFPYPNRLFFITPYLNNQILAHGAFAELISQDHFLAANNILVKALRPRSGKNDSLKKTLTNFEKIFCSSKRILLVGCGTDEPLLFRMLHPRNEIICIDLSKKNIKIAKKKLFYNRCLNFFKLKKFKQAKTEFIVGDANVILEQKYIGKFDYIQCFGVLHHQPKPETLLSGITDRLSVGGTLRMMVYSYHGRRLERKIQKKYAFIWKNISKIKKFKLLLLYNFLIIRIWQCFNFFGLSKTTSRRFKYLGLNSNFVADALMHPSDPGLCLETILPMAQQYNLRLIYCQAKIENKGLVYGLREPMEIWKKIIEADKNQALLSNPILIFTKVC